jgi:hypothetical protein
MAVQLPLHMGVWLVLITTIKNDVSCDQSQIYSSTDGQSVSQYVFVSSPLWDLRPDITSCLKVAVLSLWGALSDETTGPQFTVH